MTVLSILKYASLAGAFVMVLYLWYNIIVGINQDNSDDNKS